MRELTRIFVRVAMIAILLGGCVHNIYHFSKLSEKGGRYHPSYSYGYDNNNRTEDDIEIEDVYETQEYSDSIDLEDEEYNQRARASSYRY